MRQRGPMTSTKRKLEALRKKIVLYSVLYTLAALLLISLISILPLVNRLKTSEEINLLHAAKIRTLAVEEYLARVRSIAQPISNQTYLRALLEVYNAGELELADLEEETGKRLKDALSSSEELVGIIRLDARRNPVTETGVFIPPGYWIIPEPEYRKIEISNPCVIDNRLYLVVGSPVVSEDGSWQGTDIFLFTTYQLQRIIWDQTNLRESGDSLLGTANRQARIFFPGRRGEREIYNRIINKPLLQRALQKAKNEETGLLRSRDKEPGQPDIVAFAPVAGTDWGLLVTMDEGELYARVYRLLFSIAGTVILLASSGGIGVFLLLGPLTGKLVYYSDELEKANKNLQQEVQERKRAEEGLRRSEEKWSLTFEAITDMVVILNKQGEIVKMNPTAASCLNAMSPKKQGEAKWHDLFGFSEKEENAAFDRMMTSRQPEFGEIYEPRSDRYFHISVYPLPAGGLEFWGGVFIAQDITEQKRVESMKDEMISAVSHEMRTPLTAMLGFIEFLLENEVSRDKQRDFLLTVRKETERLNDLISNFLDLQRLQAQLETYHFEPLSPEKLLQEAAHFFSVASRKHKIILECPKDLPRVRGDQRRLQQVLKNFISNAIKYSPEGGPIQMGARAENGSVIFRIQDQGIGIPAQAMQKIFNRFYRVDDSVRRIPGGIGLGLALVREVIHAHHGRVWVESTLGKGSTFYFSLPVFSEEKKEQDA